MSDVILNVRKSQYNPVLPAGTQFVYTRSNSTINFTLYHKANDMWVPTNVNMGGTCRGYLNDWTLPRTTMSTAQRADEYINVDGDSYGVLGIHSHSLSAIKFMAEYGLKAVNSLEDYLELDIKSKVAEAAMWYNNNLVDNVPTVLFLVPAPFLDTSGYISLYTIVLRAVFQLPDNFTGDPYEILFGGPLERAKFGNNTGIWAGYSDYCSLNNARHVVPILKKYVQNKDWKKYAYYFKDTAQQGSHDAGVDTMRAYLTTAHMVRFESRKHEFKIN